LFDHFLKGEDASKTVARMPKVRYFTMGSNKWQSSDTWPPATAKPTRRAAREMAASR
jgi:hypothetical protein